MATVGLAKKAHRLMRRIDKLTDGQAAISDINWDDGDFNKFCVTIRPKDGPYKGGRFKFTVSFPDNIEQGVAPGLWCDTPIYHPNIDAGRERNFDPQESNICLPDLQSDDTWHPIHGVEGIVLGLVFLLYHPNHNDALVGGINPETFEDDVKTYLSTGTLKGKVYKTGFKVIDGKLYELDELTETDEIRHSTADGQHNNEVVDVDGGCAVDIETRESNTEVNNTLQDSAITSDQRADTLNVAVVATETANANQPEAKHAEENDVYTLECNKETDPIPNTGTELEFDEELDEDDIKPVVFIGIDTYDEDMDAFFATFESVDEQLQNEDGIECEIPTNNEEADDPESDTNNCLFTDIQATDSVVNNATAENVENEDVTILEEKREYSNSFTNIAGATTNRLISRSISLPDDINTLLSNNNAKDQKKIDCDRIDFTNVAFAALGCILCIFKNTQ